MITELLEVMKINGNHESDLYDSILRRGINLEIESIKFLTILSTHYIEKLAYEKANNPKKFWESTLKNISSSYRKWVHLYEACRNGVNVNQIINKKGDCSIYAENRRKKFHNISKVNQLKNYGYWNMRYGEFFPNCYFYKKDDEYLFSGLIASVRMLNYKPKLYVCYIGVSQGKFIEVLVKNKFMKSQSYGLKGRALIKNVNEQVYTAHIAVFY